MTGTPPAKPGMSPVPQTRRGDTRAARKLLTSSQQEPCSRPPRGGVPASGVSSRP